MRGVTVVLIALLTSLGSAFAAEYVLRLDPAATTVTFTLAATLHTAEGRLPMTEGEIRFDSGTGAASGRIVLAAGKATTDHEGRDRKMHEEVLESARFPEIAFTPARVELDVDDTGSGAVVLSGVVAIHGAEHPASIKGTVRKDGDRVSVDARLLVPYVDWGLADPSVFVMRVAKKVDVAIAASGTLVLQGGEAQAP